ncbi:hypothetical protein RYX36_012551, partial [Vicia faba]
MVGSPSDWSISIFLTYKRIYSMFDGCSTPFYDWIFQKLGVRLPLTAFKNE